MDYITESVILMLQFTVIHLLIIELIARYLVLKLANLPSGHVLKIVSTYL
jgi:hypothetical protein